MDYSDVTIKQYEEMRDFLETKPEDINAQVKLISILCGIDELELWDMPLPQYEKYASEISFLTEPIKVTGKVKKELEIDGEKYILSLDERYITTGQYIDYRNYCAKDENKHFANILSCFIIPVGHKYCDGYDVLELTNKLREKMDILTALNIMTAIKKKSQKLIRRILTTFKLTMRYQIKNKQKRKQVMKEIQALINLF